MAAKIPTPDTVERPAAQKRESLKGLVFSDKTNSGLTAETAGVTIG